TGAQAAAPGVTVRNLGNPDIKWESTTQTDIGLDASLLNGKVNLTVDYYDRKTSDMLVNVPVPVSLGAPGNSIARNAGSMTNRGLEISLGYRESKRELHWSVDANFSTLNNEVTSLGGGRPIVFNLNTGSNNASTRTVEGQPIAYFWGLQTDGIFQSESEVAASAQKGEALPGDRRFKDLNGDGKITADDRTNLGNGLPKYLFGATLKADYKGFDFSVLLQGQAGNKIANNTRRQLYDIRNFNGAGVQNVSRDLLGRWTGTGTSNDIPRIAYNNTPTNILFSSYYIEDGAFLRCRNVQVGYTLPSSLSQKLKANRIRVYLSAQNLFTLTRYSGFDPEIGSLGANVLTTGFEQGRYPVSKMFIGGLNLSF
ncbi:MAG: TonB-dependent receptor, partial [Bacteroidetes bacterium]|nr:TonB-dependent receptor [Fibrella sp.]